MNKLKEYHDRMRLSIDKEMREDLLTIIQERNEYIKNIEDEKEKMEKMILANENDKTLFEYMKKANDEIQTYSVKQVNQKRASEIYEQY